MALSTQDISAGVLNARLGMSGFNGISAAVGATTTNVDVTVAAGAFALFNDGVFVDTIAQPGIDGSATVLTYLATVSVPIGALGDASNYFLYLTHSTDGFYAPTWYISTAANKVNTYDLKVAAVTIAGGIVTVATTQTTGLVDAVRQLNLEGATVTTAPSAGGGASLPATPVGYVTLTINGSAHKVAYY